MMVTSTGQAYVKVSCVQALQADILERPSLTRYHSEPQLISLSEDKQYRDSRGRVIKIEIRGERTVGDCYFLAKDVERGFGIKGLEKQLLSQSGHSCSADYMLFRSSDGEIRMFLTYMGFGGCVSEYMHPDSVSIITWITDISDPTIIRSTPSVRKGPGPSQHKGPVMFNDIAGIPLARAIKLIKNGVGGLQLCSYIIHLGMVKGLRDVLTIPAKYTDDMNVIHYGGSTDLVSRLLRCKEHFDIIGEYDPHLISFARIDLDNYRGLKKLVRPSTAAIGIPSINFVDVLSTENIDKIISSEMELLSYMG
ncbi:Hypothetical protein MVR_LOCUS66 [uncultured virus]|nr:Hypothetical protein MVR_LOCUS66 [uncultured virus]